MRIVVVVALVIVPALGHAQATPVSPAAPTPKVPGANLPPPPVEQRVLEVRRGTAVVARWSTEDMKRLTPLPNAQQVGGKAHLFALKDALAKSVGADARVVAVILEGNQRVAIDEKQWSDPARVPVLWQNRRGLFKLGWVDAKGVQIVGAPELRDVRALELAPQ